MADKTQHSQVAIIGGGPAGLMAAEYLSARGHDVCVYERKPSVGRKFLMAGRGGLNLTHSETLENFLKKYGARERDIAPMIHGFTPQDLRDWCENLGQETFIGTSGRVFPRAFKASPLMRAWLARLENQGVRIFTGHDWAGWDDDGALVFQTASGSVRVKAKATLLALGGASWPRLGADGGWVDILRVRGMDIAPLRPSNCGFAADWSDIFAARFAGHPLKPVTLSFAGQTVQGELMITAAGIEGGVVYALSARLRDAIAVDGVASLLVDLKPDMPRDAIIARLQKPRGRLSFSNYVRKTLNLSDVAVGLLMERPDRSVLANLPAEKLADLIKAYPLRLQAPFAIERAISSAGGLRFEDIDENLMLCAMPGVFAAGEMLDWEAPTGGYLLQACMAGGVQAAKSIVTYLQAGGQH